MPKDDVPEEPTEENAFPSLLGVPSRERDFISPVPENRLTSGKRQKLLAML